TAVAAMAERMAAPDEGSFDHFAPENVSAVVAWLCSEASRDVTGQVIEAEGGRIAIADGWRSTVGIDKGSRWLPADVGHALEESLTTAVPAQQVWGT
ncbi:MAG: short-chain dehydrogenase, partial [Luminiphilus sp.]|nr:short-chain dehydrogenase [Luminiphilus sp.]